MTTAQLRPDDKDSLLVRFAYYFIKMILLGPFIRTVWIKRVEGLENLPSEGAVIIASNHASYLDFFCFCAASPRYVRYLAAEKFFQSPLWRILMVLTGQIQVDRKSKDKSKAYRFALSSLERGKMIGIFPEGTRSATGELQPAYTGVARLALESGAPVVPVGIIGAYDVWPRWGKYPKWKKAVTIRIGKPTSFSRRSDYINEDEYRAITDSIMEEIAEIIGKAYPRLSGYQRKED